MAANPIAMIASFGMALRYSFGLIDLAGKLDEAIARVLGKGLRTKDIAQKGEAHRRHPGHGRGDPGRVRSPGRLTIRL